MPVVSLTLEDSNRTLLSPSYFKIIKDITESIKIPYASLIVMHKDREIANTDNKTNVSMLPTPNLPHTSSSRRILVNVSEEYNENALTTTAVNQQSAYPIFQDHDIDVVIYPIYIQTDISIDFSYNTPSKTEANRVRDDIRLRLSQTRNINIHEIEYSIIIPEIVEEFITDVYELKNRLIPSSLKSYFNSHSTNRIYPITDMSNKENTRLAIHEKQVRIVGLFDFNSMPEKIESDNENNSYKINFTYKFSLSVPKGMCLRYPVMICNKPLPSKYISFIEENKITSKKEMKKNLNYISGSLAALSIFEAHRELENKTDTNLPINIPLFDDFNLRQKHKGYAIFLSLLLEVDETDKKSLFNLRDIDPYYIPDLLLNHIRDVDRNYVTKPYSSFIYLGLHQDGIHFDNNILEVDKDLNVKSKLELSLFKPIRVTISMNIDISMLLPEALERIFSNEDIFLLYINEYINTVNNFKTESSVNRIDNTFYKILFEKIRYYLDVNKYDMIYKMLLICSKDNYISIYIGRLLLNGYTDLYRELVKNKILSINGNFSLNITYNQTENSLYTDSGAPRALTKEVLDYNEAIKKSYNNINIKNNLETFSMKTVMEKYVVALRKDT